MRTTLTLDDDISERLRAEAELSRQPFKQVVNRALRRGLGMTPPIKREPFRVRVHDSAFRPGVDTGRLNQLLDELETETALSALDQT